jgi:type IV pilus assembly protein PilV
MNPRSRSRTQQGFSLIEVMVSLAILSVGLIGLTAGQVMAMKISSNSRNRTLAMQLAEQQVEELQAMSGDDVKALIVAPGYPYDPSNPIDPDPADETQMAFTRRSLVTANTPEAGVIRLAVEVAWQDNLGVTRTARVETLKADR